MKKQFPYSCPLSSIYTQYIPTDPLYIYIYRYIYIIPYSYRISFHFLFHYPYLNPGFAPGTAGMVETLSSRAGTPLEEQSPGIVYSPS